MFTPNKEKQAIQKFIDTATQEEPQSALDSMAEDFDDFDDEKDMGEVMRNFFAGRRWR